MNRHNYGGNCSSLLKTGVKGAGDHKKSSVMSLVERKHTELWRLSREINQELGRTLVSRSRSRPKQTNKAESRPRSLEYICWTGMIGRCTRRDTSWKKYGARGIKICERWLNRRRTTA